MPNAQLNALLCAHDVLILPSIAEPWGLVVEEALAVGLVVLVSQACGARVLVENGVNGFVFEPTDGGFQKAFRGPREHLPHTFEGGSCVGFRG